MFTMSRYTCFVCLRSIQRRQEKVTKEKATPLSVTVFGVRAPFHRAYGSPEGGGAAHRREMGV